MSAADSVAAIVSPSSAGIAVPSKLMLIGRPVGRIVL